MMRRQALSLSASASIKHHMTKPKVPALGTFVAVNEEPAAHLRVSTLMRSGFDMHPQVLPFDIKVRRSRCLLVSGTGTLHGTGCLTVQLTGELTRCCAASQRGQACEKYFAAFTKKPTAKLEALLSGIKMTVFDVPTLNRKPFVVL